MLKPFVYRSLYVILWMFLALDALLLFVYPISLLLTLGLTLLLMPALLLLLWVQFCIASFLEASGFFTEDGTRSLLSKVKLVTSGFGLIRSAWLYLALIVALALGMYFLFRNHHQVKAPQRPRQHASSPAALTTIAIAQTEIRFILDPFRRRVSGVRRACAPVLAPVTIDETAGAAS
jgi:hypothetical protein